MKPKRSIATVLVIGVIAAVLMGTATIANANGVADRAQGSPRSSEHDRALAAFNELRERQYQAWDDEDGAAFAATFTEDADMVTFNGDYLRTRDGIARDMQYYFDNFIEADTIRLLDEHVRFVDRQNAIIVRTTCLVDDGQTECRDGSLSTNTNVMTKQKGAWLQESFQNTRKVEIR